MTEPCGRHVLVVEDDPDVRDAILEMLEDHDYASVPAANGKEALDRLRAGEQEQPCLILLDLMMPVMDGWQFRAEQTQDEMLSRIPVVVVTAHPNARETAEKMGASGFLRKPFTMKALLEMVERYCGRSDT